jgi:hypothetical protein
LYCHIINDISILITGFTNSSLERRFSTDGTGTDGVTQKYMREDTEEKKKDNGGKCKNVCI